MKKFGLGFPMILLVFFLYSPSAAGMGYGVYVTGNAGSVLWGGNLGYKVSGVNGGFGFVMDTAVAKDKLFNFRLNVGADILNSNYRDASVYKLDVLCSFGFGVIRTDSFRFWIGPQIGLRLNFDSGKIVQRGKIFYEGNLLVFGTTVFPSNATYDIGTGGVAGGLIMGINYNLGQLSTIALDFGGRAHVGSGTISYDGILKSYDKKETAWGYEGFVNLSFIFRVNDSYGKI